MIPLAGHPVTTDNRGEIQHTNERIIILLLKSPRSTMGQPRSYAVYVPRQSILAYSSSARHCDRRQSFWAQLI